MSEFSYIAQKKDKNFNMKGSIEFFTEKEIQKALNFHKSFDGFAETDLVQLKDSAKRLGLSNIYVKDESSRFGINSFKGLGAAWAMGNYIAEKLDIPIEELPYDRMISDEIRKKLGNVTFASCTDGNHGRGVAWVGQMLQQEVKIFMPKGSGSDRVKNIEALGAEVIVTDLNYDDTIRFVMDEADKNGWIIVQDTSWEGYVDIPKWIMQGYSALVLEAYQQIERDNLPKPTHAFLQAGVGAMAGGACGLITNLCKEDMPTTIILEPNEAAAFYKSAVANDGKRHFVTGDMPTIMAGLACGEPGIIAWDVISEFADGYVSCPDWISANGMRLAANPVGNDKRFISGESAGVSYGLTNELMINEELKDIKNQIGLDENSIVLCISTEGDTDVTAYQDIVWYGKYNKY
ncbi:diaminopropionate ammonia-lyase [Miniphocaeibacter massiliensis]|uniref:diaminopropionate ammonia-lyase n=1 Tax=Miniphocaeibacter massiliensis TaxID=2041841 RepID=UPI000C1C825D|nr:diaminopropionate ammonia-lyase [Miniphocaeibacter massiliensis]